MNVLAHFPECSAPLDTYATALAHTQQMHIDLNDAREEIAQLKADLHREQDRVVMMVEERDRYRHESIRFRRLAERLAVKMTNAALIMDEAKDTVQEIEEISSGETPTSGAIDALEAEFNKGNEAV